MIYVQFMTECLHFSREAFLILLCSRLVPSSSYVLVPCGLLLHSTWQRNGLEVTNGRRRAQRSNRYSNMWSRTRPLTSEFFLHAGWYSGTCRGVWWLRWRIKVSKL